jgi:hypothetical protein
MSEIKDRLGRCYELNAKFVINNPQWTLVHGFINDRAFGTGNTIDHAWCELDDISYDAVLDLTLPTIVHDALFNPTDTVKYRGTTAIQKVLTTQHYGPWHEIDESKIIFNKPSDENKY